MKILLITVFMDFVTGIQMDFIRRDINGYAEDPSAAG